MSFVLSLDMHTVIMFLSYLFDQGKRYSTLLNCLAGINHNLKLRGMPDCSSPFTVKKFLQGAKNLSQPLVALLPITDNMLLTIIGSVDKAFTLEYDRKLLKAMFADMYFGYLRIGEVAISSHSNHIIQLDQRDERDQRSDSHQGP